MLWTNWRFSFSNMDIVHWRIPSTNTTMKVKGFSVFFNFDQSFLLSSVFFSPIWALRKNDFTQFSKHSQGFTSGWKIIIETYLINLKYLLKVCFFEENINEKQNIGIFDLPKKNWDFRNNLKKTRISNIFKRFVVVFADFQFFSKVDKKRNPEERDSK